MRQFLMCVTLAALVCGLALAAARARHAIAQGDGATKNAQDAIVELEIRWLGNEGNPAVLDSILADDFVHVLPTGLINKRQHIEFVRQHPRPPLKEYRFEKLDVRIYDNFAIADGIVSAVPVSGTPRRTVFSDVFVMRGGRWQAVNAQESEAANTTNP